MGKSFWLAVIPWLWRQICWHVSSRMYKSSLLGRDHLHFEKISFFTLFLFILIPPKFNLVILDSRFSFRTQTSKVQLVQVSRFKIPRFRGSRFGVNSIQVLNTSHIPDLQNNFEVSNLWKLWKYFNIMKTKRIFFQNQTLPNLEKSTRVLLKSRIYFSRSLVDDWGPSVHVFCSRRRTISAVSPKYNLSVGCDSTFAA